MRWIALLLPLWACIPLFQPRPTPVPTEDPCEAACSNLARMTCPGHRGSPGADGTLGTEDDISCAQACRDIMEADTTLALECIAGAASCLAADECLAVTD